MTTTSAVRDSDPPGLLLDVCLCVQDTCVRGQAYVEARGAIHLVSIRWSLMKLVLTGLASLVGSKLQGLTCLFPPAGDYMYMPPCSTFCRVLEIELRSLS